MQNKYQKLFSAKFAREKLVFFVENPNEGFEVADSVGEKPLEECNIDELCARMLELNVRVGDLIEERMQQYKDASKERILNLDPLIAKWKKLKEKSEAMRERVEQNKYFIFARKKVEQGLAEIKKALDKMTSRRDEIAKETGAKGGGWMYIVDKLKTMQNTAVGVAGNINQALKRLSDETTIFEARRERFNAYLKGARVAGDTRNAVTEAVDGDKDKGNKVDVKV